MRDHYDYINRLVLRWGILLVLAMVSSFACAQNIGVSSFRLLERDLTATIEGTTELDQNGDKAALIKVVTTQTGFEFDCGILGVVKTVQKTGEIWLYVPRGVKRVTVKHPQLGVLRDYEFGVPIEGARTYEMVLTTQQVFVNRYDDSRKQDLRIKVVPAGAVLTLNGMNIDLDSKGEVTQNLSFGTYTYKVMAEGYYPKEGQVEINDSVNAQSLVVDDLRPVMGKLSVHVNPMGATVMVDGKAIPSGTALDPYSLQIGTHRLLVKCDGYKPEDREVVIEQDRTTDVQVTLSQLAVFSFTSKPSGAMVFVDGERLSSTPCSKEMKTGTYEVTATKVGYKDFRQKMVLSSSSPDVNIVLKKIYNYRNEFYAEAGLRAGSCMAYGVTLGCYLSNVNVELSAMAASGSSETIYWCSDEKKPVSAVYHPKLLIGGKVGYGMSVGTRYRVTPQIGLNCLKLSESMEDGSNLTVADGSNVVSAVIGARLSAVIANHFGVSLSPEYSFAVVKSNGYRQLDPVSSKIKGWGQGLNVKLGLMIAF